MADDLRVSQHGEKMAGVTDMSGFGEDAPIHCCACWNNTDDKNAIANKRPSAVTILVNSGTLAVENSEAFKAADAYLAAQFKSDTPMMAPRF